MKFLKSQFSLEESNIVVFGVPIGKRFKDISEKLRKTSIYLEVFDIDRKRNLLENIKISDLGDLEIKNLEEIISYTKNIVQKNKIPLLISGDHPTLFSFQAFDEKTKIISFDAHCDLKDEYEDEKIIDLSTWSGNFDSRVNGATWLRRLCEKIDPKNILLLGIRSCDEDELKFIEDNDIHYFTSSKIKEDIKSVKQKVKEFTKNSKLYITLDIDVFDPSIAPAVHHPEPNGIFFNDFRNLLESFKGKLVGLDVCCLNPIQNNEVTEFLVIRSIFEILGLIS